MTSQMKTSLLSLIPASTAIAAFLLFPVHAGYAGSILFLTGFGLILAHDYGRSLAPLKIETAEPASEVYHEDERMAA